jgi:hypothetical protein
MREAVKKRPHTAVQIRPGSMAHPRMYIYIATPNTFLFLSRNICMTREGSIAVYT